jgi:ribonuclease BN (tRNA processing enzyme)
MSSSLVREVVIQVLGSGGPMHGEGRGGASYLVWIGGRPIALLDVAGDTPTKLSVAGVRACDIDILLISHLHPDHISGLPDFLWGEMTANRSSPLLVTGPSGGNGFLDTETFLKRLFGGDGAFAEMSSLFGTEGFRLDIRIVDVNVQKRSSLLSAGGLEISALPVSHGRAPALAYRLKGPDFRIVFGCDQSYKDPEFVRFAQNADMLFLHAITTDAAALDPLAEIVGVPKDLGETARLAKAKHVVLSHMMKATNASAEGPLWSLADIAGVKATVAEHFSGTVTIASDMDLFSLRV